MKDPLGPFRKTEKMSGPITGETGPLAEMRRTQELTDRMTGQTGPLAVMQQAQKHHDLIIGKNSPLAAFADPAGLTGAGTILDLVNGMGKSLVLPQDLGQDGVLAFDVANGRTLAASLALVTQHNRSVLQGALAGFSTASTVGNIAKRFAGINAFEATFQRPATMSGIALASQGAVTPYLDSVNILSEIGRMTRAVSAQFAPPVGLVARFEAASTAALAAAGGDYAKFASGLSLAGAAADDRPAWAALTSSSAVIDDVLTAYGLNARQVEAALIDGDPEAAGRAIAEVFAALVEAVHTGGAGVDWGHLYGAISLVFLIMQAINLYDRLRVLRPMGDQAARGEPVVRRRALGRPLKGRASPQRGAIAIRWLWAGRTSIADGAPAANSWIGGGVMLAVQPSRRGAGGERRLTRRPQR